MQEGARVLLLRRRPSPTEELYLTGPLEEAVPRPVVDVRDIGRRNWLPSGNRVQVDWRDCHVVVSRYCSPAWMSRLRRGKGVAAGIYYLVDDDLTAALRTPGLPSMYRARISHAAIRTSRAMLDLADRVVCCSPALATRLGCDHADVLAPALIHKLPDLSHFDRHRDTLVAYHGTASHRRDIKAISSALEDVHSRFHHLHFQFLLGRHLPARLRRLTRTENGAAMDWLDFRKYLGETRAHIALAPLMDTPYNRAKSHVKILDIAAIGAAGVYSNRSPYSEVITHGKDGLLVDDDPSSWAEAISRLAADRALAHRIALKGQVLARRIGDPEPARKYWLDLFKN